MKIGPRAKITIGFLALWLLLRLPLLGQNLPEDLLNSAVFIRYQTGPNTEARGSGFIITRITGSDPAAKTTNFQLILVTNKHMIPPEHGDHDSLSIRITVRDGASTIVKDVSIKVLDKGGHYLPTVSLHPNNRVDVAAIDISAGLVNARASALWDIAEKHTAVTTDLLVRKEDLKDARIGVGTSIFVLGYPAGVYDPTNAQPILRQGAIASEPDRGYSFEPELAQKYNLPSPIPGFLIDANVYPGSSGSLVVRNADPLPGLSLGGKASIPYILGIVADSIPIKDIWGTTRMGLGVVFGADTILDTIRRLP